MKQILTAIFVMLTLTRLSAQENKLPRTINVNGTAEMEIVPDEIYVQIDLREYEKKGVGKKDIEKIQNEFLNAVKSIGLTEADISVQAYSGWDPNSFWYHKNKKKDPNMMAGITYEVKLSSTQKMDELVKKMDDEATQNFFLSKVSHSKIQDFKKQLKIQAIMAAKEKAAYLAQAIGESVGGAITINEPNEIGNYPVQMYKRSGNVAMEAAAAGYAAPMHVDFKKMKLRFDVNVVFALK